MPADRSLNQSKTFVSPSSTLHDSDRRYAVVYASDINFWAHTFTSIYSLVVNNRDLPLDLYVLLDDRHEDIERDVRILYSIHNDLRFHPIVVDEKGLETFPINLEGFTASTYYRILIGSLLPASVQKLLYLDADTAVRGSLQNLFATELEERVLAAVPHPTWSVGDNHWKRLGLPEYPGVFNCGVLLIDLERWRHEDVENRAIEYIEKHRGNRQLLLFQDQDALNAVLIGRWMPLDISFNYGEWTLSIEEFAEVAGRCGRSIEACPVILHYAGKIKPWHGGSLHPYEGDYWSYRQRTPYADRFLLVRSKISVPRRYIRFFAPRVIRALPMGEELLSVARRVRQKLGSINSLKTQPNVSTTNERSE